MLLRSNRSKLYGIPYQGSKSKIIDKIAKYFPNAENFYDLFGGGFSVTHYMIEHRNKSYNTFYYNEIRPNICELITKAIDGFYSYDNFKPQWISRNDFHEKKEKDAYIKLIWSFGNNGRTYLFGPGVENKKRSIHMAVVFDEFDEQFKSLFGIDKWPNRLSITGKRLLMRKIISKLKIKRLDLQRLEQLERLQQLQQLQKPNSKLILTNLDYRTVEIKNNSVIYCDIPYKNTGGYGDKFDHGSFFEWAAKQENPVFISEYNIKDNRFFLIKEFMHRSTLSPNANNLVIEKLYGNKIAYEIIDNARKNK